MDAVICFKTGRFPGPQAYRLRVKIWKQNHITMNNRINRVYYGIKPLIPRRLQVYMRSLLVQKQVRLHEKTWPIDHSASREPEGWPGWPSGKRFALVLTHDVDTQKGHDCSRRLAELERQKGFRSIVCNRGRRHEPFSGTTEDRAFYRPVRWVGGDRRRLSARLAE